MNKEELYTAWNLIKNQLNLLNASMINIDEQSINWKSDFLEKMEKQRFITEVADVGYMCYYLKIAPEEFWRRFIGWEGKDGL